MVEILQVVVIGIITGFAIATDLIDTAAMAKDANAPLKTVYKKCIQQTAKGMYGADCSGRDLTELPKNLKSSIEILDASYNRIRHIDAVSSYSKLKYLYLGDNFIVNLEPGTVDKLDYLETLDLSVNAMQRLPAFVFQISTLRRLYISNNSFRYDFLEGVEYPIRAPLEFIDLSYSEMTKMPFFGILLDLHELNISGNPFYKITVDDLSPLCRLKKLDVTNIGPNHIDECDCFKLQSYLVEKEVHVYPEVRAICDYRLGALKCTPAKLNNTNLQLHEECLSKIRIRQIQEQTRTTWTAVLIGITSFLIAFIAILYMIHRKNVKNMALEDMKYRKNELNHPFIKTQPQLVAS